MPPDGTHISDPATAPTGHADIRQDVIDVDWAVRRFASVDDYVRTARRLEAQVADRIARATAWLESGQRGAIRRLASELCESFSIVSAPAAYDAALLLEDAAATLDGDLPAAIQRLRHEVGRWTQAVEQVEKTRRFDGPNPDAAPAGA